MASERNDVEIIKLVAQKEQQVEAQLVRARAEAEEILVAAQKEAESITAAAHSNLQLQGEELGELKMKSSVESARKAVFQLKQLISFLESLSEEDIDTYADTLLKEVIPEIK